jgi:hypothetical protein
MLIACKYCQNNFILNKNETELEGVLITCEHCAENWLYESRTNYLEGKLTELDNALNQKEIQMNIKNTEYIQKIDFLEKNLKIKKDELVKQKILEERISTFEKRVTITEKLNVRQDNLEIQSSKLENEVKETTDNISIKNNDIEKKANYLAMKINPINKNVIKESIQVKDKNNDVVNLKNYDQKEKSKKKVFKTGFYWPHTSDK